MTNNELIAAIRALDPAEPNFYGEQDETHIATLERLLGVPIPPSFRVFLTRFGGGDGYTGLFKNRPDCMDLGCIFGDNLRAREKYGLPETCLLFEISPFRELYCLDTGDVGEDGECPVIRFGITSDNHLTAPVRAASSFGDYFHRDLESRLEVLQEELGGGDKQS